MRFLSTKVHTIIGLLVGVILIFSPALFNFYDTVAAMIPLWVGIFIVLNELITTSPYSPLKLVPMKVHIVIDVITGAFLFLSPWLFSFMDAGSPKEWLPHIVVGIMIIGYALVTTTADECAPIVAHS